MPTPGVADIESFGVANDAVVKPLELGGFLGIIYASGIKNGLFPLLIFMGVGAMTDFGPLLANPKTALLGAAAQFGIFSTLLGALALVATLVAGAILLVIDRSLVGT